MDLFELYRGNNFYEKLHNVYNSFIDALQNEDIEKSKNYADLVYFTYVEGIFECGERINSLKEELKIGKHPLRNLTSRKTLLRFLKMEERRMEGLQKTLGWFQKVQEKYNFTNAPE